MTLLASLAAQRWMDNDHMDGWGWVMMAIVLLLVVGVVAALVYALVRGSRDASSHSTRHDPSPLDVLDHRFARGEIDEDDYKARRALLGG